jgi:adenylate cyclase
MQAQQVLLSITQKITPFIFGICLTLFLLVLSFGNIQEINDFGNKKSLDLLSQAFPYERFYPGNAPGLLLVAIDDESMKQLGQWPWPRQTIAKIIENAKRSNVAAIGLDILFLEQDRYSPTKMASDLNLPEAKLQSLGIIDGDAKLGGELKRTSSALAFALGRHTENEREPLLQNQLASMPNRFIAANDADQELLTVPSLVFPQSVINQSPGLGFVNALEEGGLIREVPLVASYRDHLLPSLSLEMLRVAQGVNNYVIKPSQSGHALQIKVGDVVVQTNLHGQLLFHQGHISRFPQVSAYQLFKGPVSGLDGRFAVFGVNALALGDQHATSLEDSVPGAYMHLQALDQMLAGRFITMHPGLDRMIFLVCALIACLVCYLVVHVPLIYALGIVALSFSALLGVSAYCFVQLGFVFNIFVSSAILLMGGIATYLTQSIHEERLRKKMQSSFAQYVPADVVKRISKSQQAPKLGGELIEASVLFLDLRGFTSLTESLKPYPELMVQVIGAIMDEVTARLIESGATIDKYIGDAVMAFWNAPERQGDHLVRAIYGACRIQEDLELIRSKIHQMDPIVQEAKIAFGIGICCGPITVGNFGSSFRFNYTVLGDAVNTASRLESLTKEKGAPTLIAADALADGQILEFANRTMSVSLVGSTEIRGKQEVLNIFTAQFIA